MAEKKSFEERAHELSFNELIEDWIVTSKKMIGQEVREALEPRYMKADSPIPSRFICDLQSILWFARGTLGDSNPLYTDPAYAAKTRYGCLIAPPMALMAVRYTPSHGNAYARPYPLGPLFAGTEFYWFDAIRLRDRFKTQLTLKEVFEKKGGTVGRLLFLVTDGYYWNQHGDLTGKCRGHLIEIPIETYQDSEKVGETMVYERPIYSYSNEEIEAIERDLEKSQDRRGAEPRYWEDVKVGDKLPTNVKAQSMTVQDQVIVPQHLPWRHPAFELAYREEEGRAHPVTKVPWGATAEHEDAMLCRFRGLPGPFDYGAQRVVWASVPVTNWMGDDGFLKKLRADLRRPNYYGDTTWFKCEVVNKYKVKEKGEAGPGGVPGEAEYAAVDIKIQGINQIGEVTCPGLATVYLPSRELGPVKLPIPHPPRPEYVPFASLRI